MKTDRVTSSQGAESIRSSSSATRLVVSPRSIEEFRARIAVGDLLAGRVLENVDEGRSIVRFLDFNVVAESQTPMERGATVRAEVTAIGDQVLMRLLQPGGSLEQAVDLLDRIGVPTTRANLEVVALMARAGVPMTPANLVEILNAASGNPSIPPDIAVLARSLGVPLSPSSLDALAALAEPIPPLGDGLASLQGNLAAATPILGERGEAARTLAAFLTGIVVDPNAGNVAEQTQRFLAALGLGVERAVQGDNPSAESLKSLLWAARAELGAALGAAGPAGSTTLAALAGNIDGLLRQLDALQLLARLAPSSLPNLYLHYAYWAGIPRPLTLEVRHRSRSPGEETEADNTDIEFAVRTQRWGVVRVRMAIRDGSITGRLETETTDGRQFAQSRIGTLVSRLGDIGYTVQAFGCMVAGKRQEPVVARLSLSSAGSVDLEA
ncbi:hypothetical protein FJZ36_08570 [Candidatus Poribacteria bacterium]|nr:hypothetical protein [Candidatus Poribacteria bacterium]